jgi:hypothetical protein
MIEPGKMTTPFGWISSSPPPISQLSGMSAPVTTLQKRCSSTQYLLSHRQGERRFLATW